MSIQCVSVGVGGGVIEDAQFCIWISFYLFSHLYTSVSLAHVVFKKKIYTLFQSELDC